MFIVRLFFCSFALSLYLFSTSLYTLSPLTMQAALRRIVREPTYWEKLTNGGPELSVPEQPSVFYTDREYNYCKVWFLGRELELLSLNILAYSIFDLWFGYTTTSLLLTYLLDLGICYLRQEFGRVSLYALYNCLSIICSLLCE